MNNIIVEKSVKALAGTVYSDSAEYEKTVERLFGEGCEIVRKEGKNCSRLDVYRKGTYCILLDDKSAGCPVIFTTVDFFDSTIQPWRVGFFREFKADKQMFSVLERNMQDFRLRNTASI